MSQLLHFEFECAFFCSAISLYYLFIGEIFNILYSKGHRNLYLLVPESSEAVLFIMKSSSAGKELSFIYCFTLRDKTGQYEYEMAFDINTKDVTGQSALYLACYVGNQKLVDLLLKHRVHANKIKVSECQAENWGLKVCSKAYC